MIILNLDCIFAYIDPGTGVVIAGASGGILAFVLGFFGVLALYFKKLLHFFHRHRKPFLIILLIVALLGGVIYSVFMMKNNNSMNKKIVILGFDGLDPRIVERLMEQGKLPNFVRLKNQGHYSKLATTNPPQSPVAWSGFATGKNPGKTGVYDFIIRDPKNYSLNVSLSKFEKGKPVSTVRAKKFWQYATEKNIQSVILGLPMTFPPDEIKGRMLAGMGVPDLLGTEGTFSFYTSEAKNIKKEVGGRVIYVTKKDSMILDLIGPKIATKDKNLEDLKIPFRISLTKKNSAVINIQKQSFELNQNEWSSWANLEFKLGMFKKIKGMVRFLLVENDQEFKLYVSPINLDPREPYYPISYPSGYAKELSKEIGLFYTAGMPMDTWAVNEKRLNEDVFIKQAEEELAEKEKMLRYELDRMEKGVLLCYFESPDIIQHMFWRYTDPQHPLYEADSNEIYKNIIDVWYQKLDRILGETLKKVSEEDVMIVLSDHGFDTFRRVGHINSWLRENGYLELKNPYAESGEELLVSIDWSKTKAYAIGFGAVYINQKGREGEGIVSQGVEAEQLKKEIATKLEEWKDITNNQKIVSKVYTNEEMFWGPYSNEAPDLYVGFNIGYRASWQTALGAVTSQLVEDNLKKWSGSHLFDPQLIPGIILTNRPILKENPSIYDITPTLLKLFGYTADEIKSFDLDGTSLLETSR